MPHYYDENNVPLNPYLHKFKYDKEVYEFYTGSGVFSREKLDRGSEVLIKYCQIERSDKFLDLGCGIGIIGILVQKTKGGRATFSDISNNAIAATKMNLTLHKIPAKIFHSNIYEKLDKFDVILTNPPYVAGRELCTKIVVEAKNHLNKNGSLQLVARHNKGGKYFESIMKTVFGNVTTLAKKSGYRVYMSKND